MYPKPPEHSLASDRRLEIICQTGSFNLEVSSAKIFILCLVFPVAFFFFFQLEDNCFTILCWLLPCINTNQPQVRTYLLLPGCPPNLSPHPTPPGGHRALGWTPLDTQQIPTGYLFYTWWCVCFHTILSIRPTLSFPSCIHKSPLCGCFFINALQIASSVPSL